MGRYVKFTAVVGVAFLLISPFLLADVRLPSIIGNNMALQQSAEVTVWGWADPSEKVSVKGSWQSSRDAVALADNDGKWTVKIKTPKAGGPYALTIKGKNEIKLKNIIIGEVWLCSGQSNMAIAMGSGGKEPIHGGPEDIKNSANKSIRLFKLQTIEPWVPITAESPSDDVIGSWVECSPEAVQHFSAVGYYFGRKINSETGYPVGLIDSSWGGTAAQAWMRVGFISNDDNLSPMIDKYDAAFSKWQEACVEAEKNQQPTPTRRQGGVRPEDKPASLYNSMIAPLINFSIKGTIWYQGESNSGVAYLYRDLFPTLIRNWRCDFNNLEMPFYFVQLASYTTHKPGEEVQPYRGEPRDNNWAELREAQLMTNSLKNTGMAVTIDIGESNNIHPGNKKDVGERLALWALAKDYNKDVAYSGPLYAGYNIEGDRIRITFSYADGGIKFKDGKAKGFAIVGKDRKFVWADAKIEGETVVVSSEAVKEPVAVRYAWDKDPEISLYNNADLPASPFRTDDWHGVTFGAK